MNNMVSKITKHIYILFVLMLAVTACNKPFTLDLPLAVDSHEYTLSSNAGQARIFFYTNRAWSLSLEPECPWGSISRTSGDGHEDVEELLFTYEQNEEIDRHVTLVITAGDLQEKIVMSQTGLARDLLEGSQTIDDLIVKPQY